MSTPLTRARRVPAAIFLLPLLAACADESPEIVSLQALESIEAPLSREEAFSAFRILEQPGFMHDPLAVVVPVPHIDLWVKWPEHPQSRYRTRTNNLSFMRDEETLIEKPGRRILVLGDSHTQGAVGFDENFTALLERDLRQDEPGLEVLNAGTAITGPRCYLGRLARCAVLAPDVVVVNVFLGNDFFEDLKVAYHQEGDGPPALPPPYGGLLHDAHSIATGPIYQGLNQAYRFKHAPSEGERALALVTASLERIDAVCDQIGARLLVLLLPSKADVEPEDDAEKVEALREALELTGEEAALNTRLGQRLARNLAAAGIEVFDLAPLLGAVEGAAYWRSDHHLNLAGHAAVAAALAERL